MATKMGRRYLITRSMLKRIFNECEESRVTEYRRAEAAEARVAQLEAECDSLAIRLAGQEILTQMYRGNRT